MPRSQRKLKETKVAYADSQSLSIKRRPPMEAVTPSVGHEIQGQLESITVRKVCQRGHKKVPRGWSSES